jgi:hypothetical protein
MGAVSNRLWRAAAVCGGIVACSSEFVASEQCSPHEQVECRRAGCPGLKTCAENGLSFGPCECASAGGSGGSPAGGSAQAGGAGTTAKGGTGGAGSGGDTSAAGGTAGSEGGEDGGTGGDAPGGSGGSAGSGGRDVGLPCNGPNEHAFDGHCYWLGSPDKDYAGARQACQDWGGTLVAITSEAEQSFLHETFGSSPDRWIGLAAPAPLGPYVWETGEPLGFTKWNTGEPSDLPGELCVLLAGPAYPESWGNWNNIACTPTTAPYLCER